MKTLFLLIVLTQNGAGDINASFVNTETRKQCLQKASMLKSVFKRSNIPIIENRCVESNLLFSEFGHATTASKIKNYYLVYLDTEITRVTSVLDWHTCINQQRAFSDQNSGLAKETSKVYCGSSAQSLRDASQ